MSASLSLPNASQATANSSNGTLGKRIVTLIKYISVQIVVQGLSFATGLIILRTLDKQEYALYIIANSLLGALSVMSDMGITSEVSAIGGKVWHDSKSIGQLVNSALLFRRQLLVIVSLVVVPLFSWMLCDHGASVSYMLAIVASLVIGFLFQSRISIYLVILRLQTQLGYIQKIDLVGAIARSLLVGAFCFAYLNAETAILVATVATHFQYKLLVRWIRSNVDLKQKSNDQYTEQIRSTVRHMIPTVMFYMLQGQLTIWLITVFGKTENIAEVGALGRLAVVFSIFGSVTANIVSPLFARTQGSHQIIALYAKILGGAVSISLGLWLLSWHFPGQLLRILGQQYRNLDNELPLMMGGACFDSLISVLWSLNNSKGWIRRAWLQIPTVLPLQIVAFRYLDVSTISGVLWFRIVSQIPFFILQFWLLIDGMRLASMMENTIGAGNIMGVKASPLQCGKVKPNKISVR